MCVGGCIPTNGIVHKLRYLHTCSLNSHTHPHTPSHTHLHHLHTPSLHFLTLIHSHPHTPDISCHAVHTHSHAHSTPPHTLTHVHPPSHYTLTHRPHYTHTLTTLTNPSLHSHTLPHLISLIKLCKFLHLVLLQASWDFFDVVGEDGNDLMEDSEHGSWDDL